MKLKLDFRGQKFQSSFLDAGPQGVCRLPPLFWVGLKQGAGGWLVEKGKGKKRGENSSIFFLNFRQKILLVISIFTTMDGMQIKIYFVNYVCLWFLINVQNYEAHKSNCLSLYLQIGSRRVG